MNSKEETLTTFVTISFKNSASGEYVRCTQSPRDFTTYDRRGKVMDKKYEHRARIRKSLSSPGIDSKKSIPPAYLAWRANMPNRVVL